MKVQNENKLQLMCGCTSRFIKNEMRLGVDCDQYMREE